MFPIALRADLPAYIVRGNLNLSEETIEAVGFYKRAKKLGVMDRLKNLNILPHGGGRTFPDMLKSSGEVEIDNKRHFIIEMKSGIGRKIISSTEGIPFTYRGREVIVRTIELRMCDIVTRLMPIYVLKIRGKKVTLTGRGKEEARESEEGEETRGLRTLCSLLHRNW